MTGEVMEELFNFFQSFISMKLGKKNQLEIFDFIFDCVHLLYYKYQKINFKRDGSYMDTPDWTKNEKANPIIKEDNRCSQYAVAVTLSHRETKKDSQRITKIKLFIDKYNLEEINYSSKKMTGKKSKRNNLAIVLNALYAKKENIYPA